MKRLGYFILCLLLGSSVAEAEQRTLNVYNWSEYMDPAIIKQFEDETKIKVVYDNFDSYETLETKMLTGGSNYDVVVPGGALIQRLIAVKALEKLDKSKLPNLQNLWPKINAHLAAFDPNNDYVVGYNWWTVGLAYNKKLVKEKLGFETVDSWDALFKPDNAAKLKSCGIRVIDAPDDVTPVTMIDLGLDPNSKNKDDYQKSLELLSGFRPSVAKINSDDIANALVGGDACMALTWTGEGLRAKVTAVADGKGVDIDYVTPKEGSIIDFDGFAIPKGAKHIEEAYQFINFLQRPDVAAKNANITRYASANLAAKPLIDPALVNDPSVYLPDDVINSLKVRVTKDNAIQRIITKNWSKFRTGGVKK